MKRATVFILAIMLIMALALAGCKDNAQPSAVEPSIATSNSAAASSTPLATAKSADEPTFGGTVTYAYDQPFQGILEPALFSENADNLILNFISEPMFTTGDDLKTYPDLATWTESADHLTFTFKIKEGVKWHNGDELTAEDWKFALEIISSPDTTSPRYDSVKMIVGADAYHDKTATSISGIQITDPHTMVITVNAAAPNVLSSLWGYPMPKKYYAGIAIDKFADSDQVRKNPIGLGPFKVKKIQSGEYVEMVRNDDYWKGKPYLDGVIFKTIDGSLATSLLENGEADIMTLPTSQYSDAQKLDNLDLIKQESLSYKYIGFKLGKWDADKSLNIMNLPKFADKKLRQAMSYAIDRQKLIDAFYTGLGTPLAVPMPLVSWAKIPDDQINTYSYNPNKAKELLDEAGYKDTDGDGKREDPAGKKLVMSFDAIGGSETDDPNAQAILQFWGDIGLDVKLNGGALKELNAYYEAVEADDPSVELFSATWGLGSDPDPTGLWKSDDQWNYSRWVNADSDRLIAEGTSVKAFDETYRKQVYYDWQKLVNDEVPMIFLYSPIDVTAKNKRLQGVHVNSFTNQVDVNQWWVSK
ncbi:oligopeptide ABC transporter substrate-binding protein [Paenibacillus psychroresistens]|uniref:Oligopeptide ABC transporter substrate-binding protein n=1 Tax=Paenibacillus psychroresistens TaxID=1778678 RepID=A0A6B8RCW5_9BACL|nr:oligopeptide ABC transporter substrate-binding protein [Paenibacillus psychroresistens]QGQ94010.1 oligopeptide ABC transporter substrate-binding protein [Paenibacillus psychroresistens]